jgi:DNA-binding HxlR family transcriptional regulator
MATKSTDIPNWRRYRDACGMSQGLDLVGERWALLVVRELLLGPKRFTDLREGLPGVSSNILADRLDGLERSGVVRRRTLPAPAASKVYDLTEWGTELEPVVVALGRWGARSPWRSDEDEISTDGLILSFRAMFDPDAAGALETSYGIVLGEQSFTVKVADRRIWISRGAPANADANIKTDTATLGALVYEGGDLDEALRAGDVEIEGERSSVERLLMLFPMPSPAG